VVAIIAFVDVLVVWKSVQWWKSLHQIQSTPKTVDADMTFALRWNAVAFLCLWGVFLCHRYLLARQARDFETAPPPALNARSNP
jgi:heme exporter protein C